MNQKKPQYPRELFPLNPAQTKEIVRLKRLNTKLRSEMEVLRHDLDTLQKEMREIRACNGPLKHFRDLMTQ